MRLAKISVLLLGGLALGCDRSAYRRVSHTSVSSSSRASTTTYRVTRNTYRDYMTSILQQPGSPDSSLYIPGYSYFQGFIYTPQQLRVNGQVRLIGGSAAGAEASLSQGAMVTTNPDCLKERIQPSRYRYRVVDWHEE